MVTGFSGLLTATVFLPAVGALVILLAVRGDRNIRVFAVLVALADLVLTLLVFSLFEQRDGSDRYQFVDRFTWIPEESLRASYFMGVDGLSAPLFTYVNDGENTVALRVRDDDATSAIVTASVSIANVLPTANPGGPYAGGLGTLVRISLPGSVAEPLKVTAEPSLPGNEMPRLAAGGTLLTVTAAVSMALTPPLSSLTLRAAVLAPSLV